jgi:hypothetical protein
VCVCVCVCVCLCVCVCVCVCVCAKGHPGVEPEADHRGWRHTYVPGPSPRGAHILFQLRDLHEVGRLQAIRTK